MQGLTGNARRDGAMAIQWSTSERSMKSSTGCAVALLEQLDSAEIHAMGEIIQGKAFRVASSVLPVLLSTASLLKPQGVRTIIKVCSCCQRLQEVPQATRFRETFRARSAKHVLESISGIICAFESSRDNRLKKPWLS